MGEIYLRARNRIWQLVQQPIQEVIGITLAIAPEVASVMLICSKSVLFGCLVDTYLHIIDALLTTPFVDRSSFYGPI